MLFRRTAKAIQLAVTSLVFASSALVFSASALAQSSSVDADNPKVILRTTMGEMVIELRADRAPESVNNFLAYVDDNFYADTVFHRVIEGFMIQGGGFTTSFQRKTTRPPVDNEAYNGLRNDRYTIAMARTTAPHSATSQFFINSENNRNLDHTGTTQRGWGYTVFGRVIQGEEIVDAISQVRTRAGGPFSRDVPAEPIVILGIERWSAPSASGGNADEAKELPVEPANAAAANPAKAAIQKALVKDEKDDSVIDINDSQKSVSSELIKQN